MRFSSRDGDCLAGQRVAGSIVFGVRVSDVVDGEPAEILSRLRARSPSVTMPASRPASSTMQTQPKRFFDSVTMASRERAADRRERHAVAAMHDLTHLHQAGAELAARMEGAELVRRELARFQKRDGEAHRRRRAEAASRWSAPARAGTPPAREAR